MRKSLVLLIIAAIDFSACHPAHVAVVTEQTYLGAPYNWKFRDWYPDADKLFNAFDYAHATVYERLLRSNENERGLDGQPFDYLTKRLIQHPPTVPLEEAAIGPHYATLVPELVAMFSWAHMLHRQLYDIWTMPNWNDAQRDRAVAEAIAYYRSRRDLAFSVKPKSMSLMEGQPYSLVFRRENPKFNGLLWSYHQLQMALYDALMDGSSAEVQRSNVEHVVQQFLSMAYSPDSMPRSMPMSAAVAPHFADRYPEAAIIFDQLHAMHDVAADILASPAVARGDKRGAILAAAAAYRDDTTAVISIGEWRAMSRSMSHKMTVPPPR